MLVMLKIIGRGCCDIDENKVEGCHFYDVNSGRFSVLSM